jgi:hypothetical protein
MRLAVRFSYSWHGLSAASSHPEPHSRLLMPSFRRTSPRSDALPRALTAVWPTGYCPQAPFRAAFTAPRMARSLLSSTGEGEPVSTAIGRDPARRGDVAETLLGGVTIAAPFNPHLVHHLVLFRGSCGQHGSSGFVVACQTYHRAGHLRLAARLGAWEP